MSLPAPLVAELTHWQRRPRGDGGLGWTSGAARLEAAPPGTGAPDEAWQGVGPPLPPAMVAVWRAHDGFGVPGDRRTPFLAPCLWPAARARPLTASVRFGENDILFEPSAWWWVVALDDGGWCVDGEGLAARWHASRHVLDPAGPLDRMWVDLARAWARHRDQA